MMLIKNAVRISIFASIASTLIICHNISLLINELCKTSQQPIRRVQAKMEIKQEHKSPITTPEQKSTLSRIPERIIMTSAADNFFEMQEPHKTNSIRTIIRYYKAWTMRALGTTDTKDVQYLMLNPFNFTSLPSFVWYLNDNDCIDSIMNVVPRLVPYFRNESEGKFKADICRIAALYEKGGYYFDTDMEVAHKAVSISPEITFVTVTSPSLGGSFFQSFMAMAPQHPMLRINLDLMVDHYHSIEQHGIKLFGTLLGPESLYHSSVEFCQREESESWPFDLSLSGRYWHGFDYHCGWLVHNATQSEVYFFSRVIGAGSGCNH